MKQGINSMIDLFCGGFGSGAKQNRLAIMQFSDRPLIVHYFNDSQAPADLRKKVQSMEDFGGRTCTGDALEEAYDQIFRLDRGVRADTPNDTLLVTDGHANCGANLLEAAQRLQKRSKSVYALGIGIAKDAAARSQVTSVVSNEDPHHIFALERYVEFKDMISFIRDKQQGKPCVPIVSEQI
ncbi:hypothetical protein C0Q70_11414 [Pomacea canaliculata]|uniref:VWFA domain-containing protein n=2 Tax=Pomacea canaliculata TaxID=400727 RepID=A0A2T7P5X2_POMCA|nr:hypothetical protein C0Q70_11414 [Pomacea canaliculata]